MQFKNDNLELKIQRFYDFSFFAFFIDTYVFRFFIHFFDSIYFYIFTFSFLLFFLLVAAPLNRVTWIHGAI